MTHKIPPEATGKQYWQEAARTAIITSTFQDFLTNPSVKPVKKRAVLFSRFFSLFTFLKNLPDSALAKLSGAAFPAHPLQNLLLTSKFPLQ